MTRGMVYADIATERDRAHAKHGDKSTEAEPWQDPRGRRLRILLEEVGEVAAELNDAEVEDRPVDAARLRAELVQVAAMSAAWADAIPTRIGAPVVTSGDVTGPADATGFLTDDEHDVVRRAGDLWGAICRAIPDGPSRDADLHEIIVHVHGIQHAIMANAAARAYPDLYRPLGGVLPETTDGTKS